MAASVANQAAAAGVAVGTVVLCFVQFTGLYRYSDRVSQVEVLGLADKIKSSLEGLFLFAVKAVMMPVFYKVGAYFNKGEGHICPVVFMMKG